MSEVLSKHELERTVTGTWDIGQQVEASPRTVDNLLAHTRKSWKGDTT